MAFQLTPEHKAKMAEGRQRAREARRLGLIKEIEEVVKVPERFVKTAPASWPVTPGEMLGLTATDCCVDCTLERCAITGKPYCGHPNKGGLWPQDKVNPEAMERFNKARKKLLHAEVDRRP